jgi:hypothetical protein
MARLFVNTYAPLVANAHGLRAAQQFRLQPFIDGSIRREPDLESAFPSITCLCRAGRFVPRLAVDDHVVYLTRKGRYGGLAPHWRLTAVLRVDRIFDRHEDAAAWYRSKGLPLPGNCMVPENPPVPVRLSHRKSEHKQDDDEQWMRDWDVEYRRRARRHPRFLVCESLWRDLGWSAKVVHKKDLLAVFERVPGTQNPGALPISLLRPLLSRLAIAAPPSSP